MNPVRARRRDSLQISFPAVVDAPRSRRLRSKNSPLPSDARWNDILESAAHLFYTRGYHATSVEDVANAAGLLKGSLYYYITSKEDLLYELLKGIMVLGQDTLEKAIAVSDDPVQRFRNALHAHIGHIVRNQVRVGLFLHELGALSGDRRKRIQKMVANYQKTFVQTIQLGQARGTFIRDDATLMANALLGMCNWIYRWNGQADGPELPRIQDVFARIAMGGIIAAEGPVNRKQ